MTPSKSFNFKQFSIQQDQCAMKVGTDGILLGAWAGKGKLRSAMDIGTGTGVIAIMLAQRFGDAHIHAVEIDEQAYKQACDNVQTCPWPDRIQIFHSSIQEFTSHSVEKYELIVSNPPFFTGGTFSNNQHKNNVRHTVKLPHGDLLRCARSLLSENGSFCVILPELEGLRFIELANAYNLYCVHLTEVRPKKNKSVERLLLEFKQEEKSMHKDEIVIQNEGRNDWTEAFVQLTGAFYLKMPLSDQ